MKWELEFVMKLWKVTLPFEHLRWIQKVNRIMLLGLQRNYISYETLKRDLMPCSIPGSSYYNCGASPEANHCSKGCSIIPKCARL